MGGLLKRCALISHICSADRRLMSELERDRVVEVRRADQKLKEEEQKIETSCFVFFCFFTKKEATSNYLQGECMSDILFVQLWFTDGALQSCITDVGLLTIILLYVCNNKMYGGEFIKFTIQIKTSASFKG